MYHIIANPVAGKKKARKNLIAVEKVFKERGVEYEVWFSGAAHDAEDIARKLTEKGETDIIVLGGDGTLHEVLNGLVDPARCRLGLVPSGTGNDFAEKLGLPFDPAKAAELILSGAAKDTDYIQIGDRRSMNVAGVGIDVDVLQRCQRGRMKGKLKYLISLIQSLMSFKGYRVEIETEQGEIFEREVLISAVCNGDRFGGGIKICPAAEVDDGKLSVVIVDCIGGVGKIIGAFMQLMKGKILSYPATTHFLCEKVRFRPQVECAAQLDGELYTEYDFTAEIKRGLKFFRA